MVIKGEKVMKSNFVIHIGFVSQFYCAYKASFDRRSASCFQQLVAGGEYKA